MAPSKISWSSESYKVTVTNVLSKKDDLLTGSAFFPHPVKQAAIIIIPVIKSVIHLLFMVLILTLRGMKVKKAHSVDPVPGQRPYNVYTSKFL